VKDKKKKKIKRKKKETKKQRNKEQGPWPKKRKIIIKKEACRCQKLPVFFVVAGTWP
jgi:hypothetical protein